MVSDEWLTRLVVLVKERAKTLVEMVEWVKPYFGQGVSLEEDVANKFLTPDIAPVLAQLVERFAAFPAFSKQEWEALFQRTGARNRHEDGPVGAAGSSGIDRPRGKSWIIRRHGGAGSGTNHLAASASHRHEASGKQP